MEYNPFLEEIILARISEYLPLEAYLRQHNL